MTSKHITTTTTSTTTRNKKMVPLICSASGRDCDSTTFPVLTCIKIHLLYSNKNLGSVAPVRAEVKHQTSGCLCGDEMGVRSCDGANSDIVFGRAENAHPRFSRLTRRPRQAGSEQTAHVELKAAASRCVLFCRCCSSSSLKAGGALLSQPLQEFFHSTAAS